MCHSELRGAGVRSGEWVYDDAIFGGIFGSATVLYDVEHRRPSARDIAEQGPGNHGDWIFSNVRVSELQVFDDDGNDLSHLLTEADRVQLSATVLMAFVNEAPRVSEHEFTCLTDLAAFN